MFPGPETLSASPGARPANARHERRSDERVAMTGAGVGVGFGSGNAAVRNTEEPTDFAMDVRIETLSPIHVARIRHVGPDDEIDACFERLFRWAASIGAPTGRVLTLSYDDLGKTAADRLRFDACVELRTGEHPPPGIELGPVGGGRYAVYRLVGPYDGIPGAYGRLLDEWLPKSGESADDRPRMELYRRAQADTPPERLMTDLCVPLREVQDGRRRKTGWTDAREIETGDSLEDAKARIESAEEKYAAFLGEAERFVYLYVRGMIRGFEDQKDFGIQLRKPKDSFMTGRGRLLAGGIIEDVRSALDYVVYALSIRNEPKANPKYPKFVIVDDSKSFEALRVR